jgi:hypothetical protein
MLMKKALFHVIIEYFIVLEFKEKFQDMAKYNEKALHKIGFNQDSIVHRNSLSMML